MPSEVTGVSARSGRRFVKGELVLFLFKILIDICLRRSTEIFWRQINFANTIFLLGITLYSCDSILLSTGLDAI